MNITFQLLSNLEEKYGDPLYFLNIDKLKGNYLWLLNAFRKIYPNTHIAYSYKANYLPIICKTLDGIGALAEVVSGMEYNLARRVGVLAENIVFNGPCKSFSDIQRALLEGATVNIDSPYEIDLIRKTAEQYPDKKFRVGIRCNLKFSKDAISRFGLDIQEKNFIEVFKCISAIKNCRITGLHCHFISDERTVEFYSEISLQMLSLAKKLFQSTAPEFINLGGGFFSNMGNILKNQFPYSIPTFEEYASAIAPHFARTFPGHGPPKLILEPGLALVADAMKFTAKVIDIKRVQKRWIALLSGSIYNIKPTKSNRMLPITILSDESHFSERVNEKFDLVGYTCMEDDIMFSGYNGVLKVGDYVLFDNVGAYTIALKPPFILPCPSVLSYYSDNGLFEIAKRPETFADIFSTYIF